MPLGSSSTSGASGPGKRLREQLALVDLLFEVRDARLPLSSRHPRAEEIFGSKPRIIVLAKQDLANPDDLAYWTSHLSQPPAIACVAVSLKRQSGRQALIAHALRLVKQVSTRKTILPRPLRASVVGLPNVGKSTLINWLLARHKTAVGNRPGITRGVQWIRLEGQLELLDTPGILPPFAFDATVSMLLSLCNILAADRYDAQDLACSGLSLVAAARPDALAQLYGPSPTGAAFTLEDIARARGCLSAGGRPDVERAAWVFLGDFRAGRLGGFVLDKPGD
jgi:ribosome biogenesis GTPase A